MARLPVHPRPAAQATSQNTRAIDQNRAAHRNRTPRAEHQRRGRCDQESPGQRRHTDGSGGEPQQLAPCCRAGRPAVGTPNTSTMPRPEVTTPITHGRQIRRATTVDPRASRTARPVDPQSPNRRDETNRARRTRTTTIAAAGTKEIRTASSTPRASAPPSRPWREAHAPPGAGGAAPVSRRQPPAAHRTPAGRTARARWSGHSVPAPTGRRHRRSARPSDRGPARCRPGPWPGRPVRPPGRPLGAEGPEQPHRPPRPEGQAAEDQDLLGQTHGARAGRSRAPRRWPGPEPPARWSPPRTGASRRRTGEKIDDHDGNGRELADRRAGVRSARPGTR